MPPLPRNTKPSAAERTRWRQWLVARGYTTGDAARIVNATDTRETIGRTLATEQRTKPKAGGAKPTKEKG